MSMRSVVVAFCSFIVAAPVALQAQQPAEANFTLARKQFIAGDSRLAAQTLVVSSLEVRQQIGRCRDEEVGSQLIESEDQLEKLAASVRAGKVGLKALEKELTRIDRVLALHHLLVASGSLAHPRPDDIPNVANDIEQAAFHFERSVTLDGGSLAAEQTAAVAEARKLSKQIDETRAIPKEAALVVAELERQVRAGGAVATAK